MAASAAAETRLTFGEFMLDRADERLIGPRGPVRIGNKAFQVLSLLVEYEGKLLTKDTLFSSVWDGMTVSESSLTSVIKELRRALGDESRTPRYIESVYGRGYRLIPPVARSNSQGEESELQPAEAADLASGSSLGQPPLLHVPPFETFTADSAGSYFSAVLREEILIALSRFRDVRLVSDVPPQPASGGTRFGERDYQLSVKLLAHEGSMKVFARLERLVNHAIIWGETVELAQGGTGSGVDDLVRKMVTAALPRLHDDVLSHLPPHASDEYEHYFHLKLKMRRAETLAEEQEVAAGWERLIARQPNLVQAYPPLIRLYNTDYCYSALGSSDEGTRARAYELAVAATALDPTEAHLHSVKGWCHLWAEEAALAREHLNQAVHLNPYNQRRLIEVATGYMYLDDGAKAAELLGRARSLTPFAAEAPHLEQGFLHLMREEFEAAGDELALVRHYHPDDNAKSGPTVMSELYALLAATGAGAADVRPRLDKWRRAVELRWSPAVPFDDERLSHWVAFHNPFQSRERRAWFTGLFAKALKT